jgi:hypothetical protein
LVKLSYSGFLIKFHHITPFLGIFYIIYQPTHVGNGEENKLEEDDDDDSEGYDDDESDTSDEDYENGENILQIAFVVVLLYKLM